MNWSAKAEVYRRRKPRESPLWKLLDNHFDEFEYRHDDLYSREYGFFRPIFSRIVRKYLECEDLAQGFARVRCPDCRHKYLLAFSCWGRRFCPSCHSKKAFQCGSHLHDTVLFQFRITLNLLSVLRLLRSGDHSDVRSFPDLGRSCSHRQPERFDREY